MAGTQYRGSEIKDVDQFLKDSTGLDSEREKEIGQHIGYRYDVNLVPDYERLTPFLKEYIEVMGWEDLNWLEDGDHGFKPRKASGLTEAGNRQSAIRAIAGFLRRL